MGQLTEALTAHVVAGKISAADLVRKANGGPYNMQAVSASKITIADVNQSDGVIHVVDHILVPR